MTPARDSSGRFVKSDNCTPSSTEPPLVHLRVTNPVTYIKLWWKKVMGKEGIDFRFRIHPVTAVMIAFSIALVAFGFGRIAMPKLPFIEYQVVAPSATKVPTPTANPWRETALTGILKITPNTNKYYLVTESIEAVTLEIPRGIDLTKYLGKRILASGNYNKSTKTLVISDVLDLEVLPIKPTTVVPTIIPTATPTVYQEYKEIPSYPSVNPPDKLQ